MPGKPTVLRQALQEALQEPPKVSSGWILADQRPIDADAVHAQLGRMAKRRIPKLRTGHFVREDTDVAPHTDVLVDFPLELCAVSPNAELAPSPDRLAGAIAQVLSATSIAEKYGVNFAASPLKEPREFFEQLANAYAVKQLWVTTLRPNPSLLDEDFVEPLAQYLESIEAEKAKTTFSGKAIATNERTRKMISSTAAHGGDAGASIQDSPESRARPIKLTASATIEVPKIDLKENLQKAAGAVRTAFEWILSRTP